MTQELLPAVSLSAMINPVLRTTLVTKVNSLACDTCLKRGLRSGDAVMWTTKRYDLDWMPEIGQIVFIATKPMDGGCFLECSPVPYAKSPSGEPVLEGWCDEKDEKAVFASGVARVTWAGVIDLVRVSSIPPNHPDALKAFRRMPAIPENV